jgi:hypothetical protein
MLQVLFRRASRHDYASSCWAISRRRNVTSFFGFASTATWLGDNVRGCGVAPRNILCHVIDDEADAAEINLVENLQREAMHSADEFDALRAARFGVPKAW